MSRDELLSMGFGAGAIGWRIEVGRLHPVHRGVYAVGHGLLSARGRWLAAVLAHGEGAVLSHRSAAVLWGLRSERGRTIDVTSDQGRAGRLGIALHRCQCEAEELTVKDSIPVTTPERTLFDLAELDPGRLRSACEEADRLGLLRLRNLERVVERGWGRRALRPIRPVVAEIRHDPDTRSPLEQRFVAFCRERNLPQPATNASVLGFEVDALWPDQSVIVELDGFAYHAHRAAFERDRVRDAALQIAGYKVLRVTHRRLDREPDAIASGIRRLVGRS